MQKLEGTDQHVSWRDNEISIDVFFMFCMSIETLFNEKSVKGGAD